MIRIQIENTQLKTRNGVSARTQKPYEIREQRALMFRDGEQYPDKVKITIEDGQSAYAPGWYLLADSSFQVSRFDGIELRPVLVPAPVKPAASAA